jgi:O-antigen/teichoic acid export membrane protein
VTAPPATAEQQGHLEKLARRGTASVLGAGCSAIFGILLVVVVTNGFSPSVAGTLFAATSTFLILESIAFLGADTGLVKFLPAQLASGRAADVRRTLVVAAVPVLVLAVVVAVCVYAVTPAIAPYLVGAEAADTMTVMLRALSFVLPVAAVHGVVLAATRGMGTMRPTVVVENIGRFGLQAAAVLVVHLAGGGPLALTLAWALPYTLGVAAASTWLAALVAARTRAAAGTPPTPWLPLAREFWAYTAARAIAKVIQSGLKRSDVVLVAALASPSAAAVYTAATRFIVLGQLFIQSVQQALSPHLAALFARGETRAATLVFQAATRWSVIAAWPLYLTIAAFAPATMVLFGDGYHTGSDVVVILALTMLLATACGPVDAVLLMAGRSWLSLRNNAVALACNVGLSVALVPVAGVRGAAIAHAVAIVIRNLLPLGQVRQQLSMWPVTRSTTRVALGAVGCFGSVAVVTTVSDFPAAVDVTLLGLAVAVYTYGVWSWRTPLGLDAFRSAMRRRAARGLEVA